MGPGFLQRQVLNLAATANALHPVPGERASVPAFFSGWLTAELAPHLLALTAADAAPHLGPRSRRRNRLGLLAAGAAATNYGVLLSRAQRARGEVESALVDAIGPDVLRRTADPADVGLPWRALINPFHMRNPDVRAERRLPYFQGGKRFELDVYHHRDRPTGAPVLLQIHGGAWLIGEKEQQGIPLMMRMAARGWVCVAINYPLSPKARWPAHLVAVKRAIAWLRENGHEYGADPAFLAVTGGSAGGHLAAMTALTAGDRSLQPGFEDVDTSVSACVPHYGVYDFTDEDGTPASKIRLESLLRRWVMAKDARYPEDYRAASPISRVRADAPPFLVLHGTNDTLVPVGDARAFVARLRAVSDAPVAYAELTGAQHAFDVFPSVRSVHVARGVEQFLEWARATRS